MKVYLHGLVGKGGMDIKNPVATKDQPKDKKTAGAQENKIRKAPPPAEGGVKNLTGITWECCPHGDLPLSQMH